MMRKLYAAALLVLAASSFAACLFPDLSSFQRNEGSGAGHPSGSGGAMGAGAGNGTGGSGASTSTSNPSGTGGSTLAPCDLHAKQKGGKGIPNPSLMVPGRCIGTTEVSWAEYEEFLVDAGDYKPDSGSWLSAASLNPACGFKDAMGQKRYEPTGYIYTEWFNHQAADNDKPVQGVDWCDASIYCRWAGKDLCGGTTGEPVDNGDGLWPNNTEWYYACQAAVPWPNTTACYQMDMSAGEVGETFAVDDPSCKSHGLYHMLSNVWEWESNCSSTGDAGTADDSCYYRGQPDQQDGMPADCGTPNNAPIPRYSTGDDHIGFRCCWAQQ